MLDAAMIGLGWWGKELVRSARESKLMRFTRGVTLEPDMARDFAKEMNLTIGTSYEDVLADKSIDAVVLATPHTKHRQQVEAAAAAGKHVFCEKPFALTVADAKAAIAACRKAGVALGVGHNRRLWPSIVKLKEVVGSKEMSLPVVDLLRTADEDTVIGHLGPDPLRDDWDLDEAVRRIGTDPARPIAAALLDQRNLAGLGNLWVNELCFLRGVSPWTPVAEVDVPAAVRLAVRALRHSALTPGAFQVTTGDNRRGRNHWVSGRFAQPCRRCGTTIEMVAEVPNDPDRRRTWWCPRCQPGPGPGQR